MQACMFLQSLPLHSSRRDQALFSHNPRLDDLQQKRRSRLMVVEAKGKRGGGGMTSRRPEPPLPKLEEDGNPKFVIFIRAAAVSHT